jgi:hypothetical protein
LHCIKAKKGKRKKVMSVRAKEEESDRKREKVKGN